MSTNSITTPPGPRGETISQFAQRALDQESHQRPQGEFTPQRTSTRDPRLGGSFVEFWLKLRTVKAKLETAASHDQTVRQDRAIEKMREEEAKATMNDEGCPNPGDKTDPQQRITRKGGVAAPSK